MRLLSILAIVIASILSTPILAQGDCCQCGPAACGPVPEGGDCSGCELITNASCDGAMGLCVGELEGALPVPPTAAPAVGGASFILLAAGLTVVAVSLLGRRRTQL